MKDENVPLPVKNFILSIAEQHLKVASLFGLTVKDAFQFSLLDIRMTGSPLGVLSSKVNTQDRPMRVYYGVFPDWNGEPLEKWIYSHELGHVLSKSNNPLLPRAYLELSSTNLATETVADALAMQSEGAISSTEGSGACVSKFRRIDSQQSYDLSEEFFTEIWSMRVLLSCCRKTLETTPLDRHWGQTCKDIILNAASASPLPPIDRHVPFDPAHYIQNTGLFDPHQLGIPVNSFLKDLQEQMHRNANALFLQAFQSASTPGDDYNHYSCKIPKLIAVIPANISAQVSMGTVLNRLRQEYSSQDQTGFQQLWKKHAIDKAVAIGNYDAKKLAESKNVRSFLDSFTVAAGDPFFAKIIEASGCTASDIGSAPLFGNELIANSQANPGCGIVCEIE